MGGWGIGDWGLGIGDWGLGPIPNPQSPIPNPQSPFTNFIKNIHYININNFRRIIILKISKKNLKKNKNVERKYNKIK